MERARSRPDGQVAGGDEPQLVGGGEPVDGNERAR